MGWVVSGLCRGRDAQTKRRRSKRGPLGLLVREEHSLGPLDSLSPELVKQGLAGFRLVISEPMRA